MEVQMSITIQIANPALLDNFESLPDGVLASVINDRKSIEGIKGTDLFLSRVEVEYCSYF
jgi:hypothetical protein